MRATDVSENECAYSCEHRLSKKRMPAAWYGTESKTGVRLGINDYLLGGETLPSVDVVAVELSEIITSEDCAKKVLAMFVKQAASEENDVEIVCEEPIDIAGKTGSSFVIIIKPKPTTQPATQPEKNVFKRKFWD